MNKAEIEALFAKFVRNEGNDRAEVTDMLWRMNSADRVKLLSSAEFVDIAVKNAAALGVKPKKKRKKPVRVLRLEDEAVAPASAAEREAVYNRMMDTKINGMLLAADIRETPNDTMKHKGLSVCRSPNGISILPVEGEGDTEVCISLEDGVINIRVYNCGQDNYSAALIVPASTRGEKA
jgi:hypothetical protein